MTILEIILLCSNVLFLAALGVSIYFNVKHGIFILRIIDSIESVLDILDEKYNSISKVLEIPLFYDSPQIRNVVEDIRVCRDSLLESANLLTEVQQEKNEEKEDN